MTSLGDSTPLVAGQEAAQLLPRFCPAFTEESNPYLACSLLEVLPQHRGQGIEDRLLQYALAQLSPGQGGKARPIMVSPSLVELDAKQDVFTRQGWREVDHFDVDLAEWMGLDRGYGTYRFPLLRREFYKQCS